MKIRTCKHCQKEFDISTQPSGWMANHSRWCALNPKRKDYCGTSNAVLAMNSKRKQTGLTNQFTKAEIEGKPKPIPPMLGKVGTFTGKTHTVEVRKIISEKARASTHRRLRKNVISYNDVLLDSSWELALAKRLDELNIKWSRPEPLPWIDEKGLKHHYFPDFYLLDYDIYLDPKNPAAIKVQQEKLKCLATQYNNIHILDTLEKCKEFII